MSPAYSLSRPVQTLESRMSRRLPELSTSPIVVRLGIVLSERGVRRPQAQTATPQFMAPFKRDS